jgi:hypothetical protein
MEAEARRQTTFAHRRGASSPAGGSRRGRFDPRTPQMTAYRQQALAVANALASTSSRTFGCLLRTPPRSFRAMSMVGEASARFGEGPTPERMM